ncbi:GntR family transcriptional regulator [Nonomuraea wenchangensis]
MTTGDDNPLSLGDDAYLTLRERIVTCRLAPGERITEKQLASDLGLGLTPIRRALQRLNHEGLVRTLPRRGYQVTPLSIASVNEVFQVWRILGPAIGELAVNNMTEQERAEFKAQEEARIQTAIGAGGEMALVATAVEVWMTLAERTGNARLLDMYVRLVGDLSRVFRLVVQDPAAMKRTKFAAPESWAFMEHPERVRQAMEEFIDTSHKAVLEILLSWPSVTQAEVILPVSGAAQPG